MKIVKNSWNSEGIVRKTWYSENGQENLEIDKQSWKSWNSQDILKNQKIVKKCRFRKIVKNSQKNRQKIANT